MILGILLGISIAISMTSLIIIITGATGLLRENLMTGAVIGTSGAVSYAIVTLIISLAVAFFIALIIKSPKKY